VIGGRHDEISRILRDAEAVGELERQGGRIALSESPAAFADGAARDAAH
jgi:hypothetical protein